uniref:Immunoglobulin subtype domain-containing protein n=1 Tax=Poecilia reticulata TaxID=8081 RepID=A0A3P9MSW1_POERE
MNYFHISINVVTHKIIVRLDASKVLEASGHVGGNVSIHCFSSWSPINVSELHSVHFYILVDVSPGKIATSGRITLVDSEDGSFTVKITQLLLSDAHVYWCAVIRSISNTYTSVNLTTSVFHPSLLVVSGGFVCSINKNKGMSAGVSIIALLSLCLVNEKKKVNNKHIHYDNLLAKYSIMAVPIQLLHLEACLLQSFVSCTDQYAMCTVSDIH